MPEDKLPIPQFAAKIKAKYPEYKDVNDTLLVQKILDKYPEYSEQVDMTGLQQPVKKKDISGNEPKFGGIVGTYAPQSEESKIAKALQTVKSSPATEGDVAREAAYKAVTSPKLQVTQEEFDEDPVSVSRKVILSKMPSVKRYDQPKSAEQEDKIAEFSFKEGDKEIENVKKFYSDNTNGSIAHLSKITGISNPDLLYSDEFDERIKSAVKPGNETDRLAYERLQDAKKARAVVRENLEQGKPFEDMAIDYAAANSPGMAKVIQQLKTTPTVDEVMGGVTSVNRRPEEAFDEATIGRFLYDFYNSSAVRQEMEKIPGMTSKVVSGANQLIQKYPSFGKMYLGNLISQKMEDMGMNNAVLNVATKKERDKAVEALVAEDKMSPLEVQFYKDNIRNLSGLGLLRRKVTGNPIIDTPGALESAAGGAYGGFKNTIGGLYELTGLRESVLGSQGALRQDLEKTNTQVSIKPKGIVNQIAMNAGQFFGQSMSIGAGGKMINNIKLAKDPMTVMGMVGATQAYANYLPQARMMFPGNELKQKAYAFILSGIEWKTEKIFNDRKVVDGLLGKLKPSVVETIKDFTEKKISSEAARANIQSAITRALKDTPEAAKYFGKAVVQNDIEELSAELGGQVSRGIFENKPFDEWIDGEDLYETTKAATLGSPIIGSLSARADMQKNRGITAKSIYSMAQDPDYWKSQIMEGAKLDETLAAEAPDKIKNLEIAAKIVQELDATKLTEKQKVKFVITELEKQLKAEQSKDAAVQAIPKAAISELEKVQQDILDGKDDGSIEGDKSDDVNPDEKKLFDMVVSKAKEGYKETLKAAETPIEGLEYLEDKYAENPVKFREDFGNDIADKIGERTSTEKLESAIDFLIQQNPDDPAIPVLDKLISERTNPPIDQQREPVVGDKGLRGEDISEVLKGNGFVQSEKGGLKKNGVRIAIAKDAALGVDSNGDVFNADSNSDNIVLREINVVDEGARGKGNATEVLRDFLKAADEAGKTIFIEPTPIKKYENKNNLTEQQLINWYERHGFKKINDQVWKREPGAEIKETESNSDAENRLTYEEAKRYKDAIDKGEMTAEEAANSIQDMGFIVPKDIQSLSSQPLTEVEGGQTVETHEQVMERAKTGQPIEIDALRIENKSGKTNDDTGVYFADKGVIDEYKRREESGFYQTKGLFSGDVKPYKLTFKNPLVIESKEEFIKGLAENGDADAIKVMPNYKEEDPAKLETTHKTYQELDSFVANKARELGHDGIILPLEYVALDNKTYSQKGKKTIPDESNTKKAVNKKSFEQRTDKEHATYIKEKFVEEFTKKGVPKEQAEAAVALMEARAKASGLGNEWYRRIDDIGNGDFSSSDIKYQGEWKKVLLAAYMALQPMQQKIGSPSKQENVSVKEAAPKEVEAITKMVNDYYAVNKEEAPKEVIERAIELWEKFGNPKILPDSTSKNERAYTEGDFYYLEGKRKVKGLTIGNITNFDDYIAEIAHALQYSSDAPLSFGEYKNEVDMDTYEYEREGSVEYEAHKLIEPILANYVFYGKKGDDLILTTMDAIVPSLKDKVIPIADKYKIKFQENKGALELLNNGRVIIHALKSPDFSTMVHEIAHVFEDELSLAERKTVQEWAVTKGWTRETSEAFARGFERYLRNGVAPSKEMLPLFQKFRKWMMDIYKSFVGTPIEKRISPEIKKIFDRLLTEQNNESTQEATKATEQKPTEKSSKPKSPTTEDTSGAKKGLTKKEIEKLPKEERDSAIDDLIFGRENPNRDAFNRQTGNPVELGRYMLSDFIKKHDISGNETSKKLLANISKHPYFNSIRLYVTDNLGDNIKGEAFITAGVMKVNPNVDAETMAHEMMHFLTSKIFDKPFESLFSSEKNLRNDINSIIKKFDPNFTYLDKTLGKLGYKRSEYAKEIIAEAFTGSWFANELKGKEIEVIRTKRVDKGLIQKIIDKIIEFFGGKVFEKSMTVREKQNVVDALAESFIKNGAISSNRLKQINVPDVNDIGTGERYGSLKSRTIDIKSAIQRMKNAGFTEEEIKIEFEKRGLNYDAAKEPPKTPTEGKGVGDEAGIGITHSDTKKIREERGLGEYEKEKQTVEGWDAEAVKRIKNGEMNALLDKMKKGEPISEVEQMMMGRYIANLDAELTKNPSKENLDKLNEAVQLSDKVGGSAWGRQGRARQESFLPDDSLGTFLMEKQAAQGTSLSEKQLKEETAKFEELKKAKEALETELAQEKEKYAKLVAEVGINKAKAEARKASKKTKEEHIKDRKAIVEAARAALKKIRGDSSLKSTIPGIAELKALAPHIKSYMQDLLNEGVDKFDNIISAIHAEFKDVLDNLRKTDVIDILAGEYDEKKEKTRNEKANELRLVKREAQLLKELAAARKGEDIAKDETKKAKERTRIDELVEKIKEVKRLRKERAEAEPVDDVTAGSDVVLDKEVERLKKRADKLLDDIKNKRYLEEKEKPPVFKKSRKAQLLEDRVIDLENKIRHERSKDEYERRSKWRKGFDKVMEILGIRRLVQSALDMSVPLRQGVTLLSPRKIDVWAKGFKANLQSIFSPKKFERIMYAIRKDPMYHDMIKDRVTFNDLGAADPNLHNEDFRKSFIYNIPIISEPLKASNRSADAFLNVARYEMYKKMRKQLENKGLTRESDPKAFSYMGNWVMSMTGRGNMTKMLENPTARTFLGNTFYGARLMASRFNMLNPVTYFDPRVPRQAKVEAMKDMAAFTTSIILIGLSLMAAGGTVSFDPDDSDFLQVRFGKKKYDISGGLSNYIRTFLRIAKAGYTKATGTKYEGKDATEKAGQSVLQFFRNKLSPNTAYATDAFFGKPYGQDFDPSEIYRIYPMYVDDVLKSFKDEGMISLATVLLPNILGVGYGSYAAKGQIDDDIEELMKRNMRSDEMNSEKIKNYNEGGRVITKKEFEEFADERDAEIEKGIKRLFNKGAVVIEDDVVVLKPYSELTKEQVVAETTIIKSNATKKIKKKLFGDKEKDEDESRLQKELREERVSLFPDEFEKEDLP